MKKQRLNVLGILLATFVTMPNDSTADIIFDLDNSVAALTDGLNNGDVVSAGGIDLTFSNVVVASGGSHGDVEPAGILISGTNDTGLTDVISFDFSFSDDVRLLTYDLGLYEDIPANSFFTVSGPNGTSGNNAIPQGTSLTNSTRGFDSGTISHFQSGAIYSFSHNLNPAADSLFDLGQFNVVTVPEPGTLAILVAVSSVAGLTRRRRK